MGQILEDMTKASSERIEKYQVNPDNVENEEESQNLEQARERGDWLFIFQVAYCSTSSRSKRRTTFPK